MNNRRPLIQLNTDQQLRINPALAQEIGFNESVVLLQLEYLISIAMHMREDDDGIERPWTYQTLEDLRELYFPWWSIATISRAIKNLEAAGLLIVGNFNKSTWDRTRWFALGDGIKDLQSVSIFQNEKCIREQESEQPQNEKSILQNEKSIFQDETTIPENTTETYTDTPPTPPATEPPQEGGHTVEELQELFITLTKCNPPYLGNLSGREKYKRQWTAPLQEIKHMANGSSADLITAAVSEMDSKRLRISSPESILNTAKGIQRQGVLGERTTEAKAEMLDKLKGAVQGYGRRGYLKAEPYLSAHLKAIIDDMGGWEHVCGLSAQQLEIQYYQAFKAVTT